MKILLFSDIHNSKKAFEKLKNYLSNNKFDLVLFAGDFTNNWQEDVLYVKEILNYFLKQKIRFLAVPGNNDRQNILDLMYKYNVNLHMEMQKVGDYEFYGIGGWANPEEYRLSKNKSYPINPKTIFVSHIPPNFKLIPKFKILPQVHIFSHKHFQSTPKVIKNCLFIQIPSILNFRIVILELPKKKVKFIKLTNS